MRPLLSLLPAVILLFLGLSTRIFSAAAPWYQDELVKRSDAIAIVDIHKRVFSTISGAVLDNGKEFPTSLILYESRVVRKFYGRIATEPLIIQYDGAGDLNSLDEGRYLLFLKSEGYVFTPLATGFKIEENQAHWYKKRFLPGDYGPEIGAVPLGDAIRDIQKLIEKYKKS